MIPLLQQAFPNFRIEQDKAGEVVLWIPTTSDLIPTLQRVKDDREFDLNLLSDITAYDNIDHKDGPLRFILVYQLYSIAKHHRLRIKLAIDEGVQAPTATGVWPAADWLERETFDMFGVRFAGHPDLRRILMDERFQGFPLRKEYDLKDRQPFPDAQDVRIIPKASLVKQEEPRTNLSDFYNPNVLVNIGPSHPATHGTLRAMCRVNGEIIEDATCEIGYLHRAIEKLAENKTYHQWIVYTDRLNYCSALTNNIAYVMTVEKILGIQITERCVWIRVICMELARIIDHLVCVAINALDMGALTCFWYLYHWREEAYTMIEGMCGMRLTTSYARVGGMMYDLPENFAAEMTKFLDGVPKTLDDVEKLLTSNRIWVDRTKGIGILTPEEAIRYGVTGPCLRASGVECDLRRDQPYYTYPELDFDVVIGSQGDVYDRYLVRMEEMRQSLKILRQCMQKLPAGPLWVADRRVQIPAKQDVYSKMEVLIHHFKIFMEGINVPEGEAYNVVEAPNGELGFYVVSRGGPKAWRVKIKSPSLLHFQSFESSIRGTKISDAIAILGSLNIIAGELDR